MAKRKFTDRFIAFFLTEQRLRWACYLGSSTIALIWAITAVFALHMDEERATAQAAAVLFVLVAICVAAYVTTGSVFGIGQNPAKQKTPRLLRLSVAAAIGMAVFALTAAIGPTKIQAAIVSFRIESFAAFFGRVQPGSVPDDQLRARYERVDYLVNESAANRIPLHPQLLDETRRAISDSLKQSPASEQTKQLALATEIDLQSLAYTRKAQTGALLSARPLPGIGNVISSALPVNTSVYFQGEHSLFTLNGGFFLIGEQAHVVFNGIDFRGRSAVSAIVLAGDQSDALVTDSTMEDVTQILDRITWVNVRFQSAHLSYLTAC